jgi:hypothetical protein
MSLPRYVINFDESDVLLREAIRTSEISSRFEVDLAKVSNAYIDLYNIETKIADHNEIYKIITETFDSLNYNVKEIIIRVTKARETRQESLSNLNNSFDRILEIDKDIKEELQRLLTPKDILSVGKRRIQGYYDYCPPVKNDFIIEHKVPFVIYLTAITYSQIGWKLLDTFSLMVDDEVVFESIATKEIAEKKAFSMRMKIYANSSIKFIHHNNSGNSKQIWVDFEYIATEDTSGKPDDYYSGGNISTVSMFNGIPNDPDIPRNSRIYSDDEYYEEIIGG